MAFLTADSRTIQMVDRGGFSQSYDWLPGKSPLESVGFIDNRLYVTSVSNHTASAHIKSDFRQGSEGWLPAPYLRGSWYPSFVGRYQGQPAVFQSNYDTEVYALKDFLRLGKLGYVTRGVGDGYMLRYQWPEGPPMILSSQGWWRETVSNPDGSRSYSGAGISGMDLLDPDQKQLIHLSPQAGAGPFNDGEAQISPDHHALMLAPRHHGGVAFSAFGPDSIMTMYYTGFAVYEVPSGKVLYSSESSWRAARSVESRQAIGTPVAPVVLTNDGVYALSEVVPPDPAQTNPALPHRKPNVGDHEFWLVRYTADGASRVVRLPLHAPAERSHDFSTVASPAGRFMVIYSGQPAPQLIEVPLKPEVGEKELRYFVLAKPPG